MTNIICIGSSVVDIQLSGIDSYPKSGNLMMVDKAAFNTGGCGLNVAFSLAKLGIEPTIITKVGEDVLGDWIVGKCKDHNIDVSSVRYTKELTSFSVVNISSEGERSILHHPGANRCLGLNDINTDIFKEAQYLCVVGVNGLGEIDDKLEVLLKSVKEQNPEINILLDVIYKEDVSNCNPLIDSLAFTDYFTPNYEEAKKLSNEEELDKIADFFLGKGLRNLIITLGKDGAYLCNNQARKRIPGFSTVMRDTTGAGDSFVAGLISALSKKYTIEESIRFANAVGAMSVQAVGATDGVPSFGKVLDYMSCNSMVESECE